MPDCGVHYLWFAFVCFLIRSHPPTYTPRKMRFLINCQSSVQTQNPRFGPLLCSYKVSVDSEYTSDPLEADKVSVDRAKRRKAKVACPPSGMVLLMVANVLQLSHVTHVGLAARDPTCHPPLWGLVSPYNPELSSSTNGSIKQRMGGRARGSVWVMPLLGVYINFLKGRKRLQAVAGSRRQ